MPLRNLFEFHGELRVKRESVLFGCLGNWTAPHVQCIVQSKLFDIIPQIAKLWGFLLLNGWVAELAAAAAAALFPKLVSLHDFAFGCRCRLVSQACLPS